MKKCPYCPAVVKHLNEHVKRKHANEIKTPVATPTKPESETPVTKTPVTKVRTKLQIEVPKKTKNTEIRYRCGWKCGYFAQDKFDICPQCGKENTWSD